MTYATKIRQLTPSNITALVKARDAGAFEILEHGATYAILPGTPAEALAALQADMDWLKSTGQPVRQTRYQSLIAVRNKLQGYVKDGVTAYVETYPMGSSEEPAADDTVCTICGAPMQSHDYADVCDSCAGPKVEQLEHTAISDPAELSESEYLAEIDRLRRELPGLFGADAFLLGYTASGLTGQFRAQAITAAREQYADSLEQEQERRQDKVAGVVEVRSAAEAGQAVAAIIEDTAADTIKAEAEDAADQAAFDSAEPAECDAPERSHVDASSADATEVITSSHTAAQAEGPLSAAPAEDRECINCDGTGDRYWPQKGDNPAQVTQCAACGGTGRRPLDARAAGRASLAEHAVANGDAEAWTQEPGDQLPLHLELNLVVDLKAWALTYGLKTSPEVIADDVIAYLRASICELAAVEEGCYLRESVTLTRLP